jgi:membrane-associated phospholipid phosphatase
MTVLAGLERRIDNLIILYLLLTALLVAANGSRFPSFVLFIAFHLTLASTVYALRYLPAKLPPGARFLRDWYPAIAFPFLYKEVELFAGAFGNWELTSLLRSLEASLFGGQPSIYLSERLAWVPLSEYLHFCYLAYVLLFPVIGGYWYFTGRKHWFRELLFLVSMTYAVSYLFYILYPVDSPFYLSPPPGEPLSGHTFYNLVHFMSERGGARGGAFPSSHVSISTVILLVTLEHQPRWVAWLLPVYIGLVFATVYGRFHYVLDIVAGLLLAVVICVGYRFLTRERSSESDSAAHAPV